MVVAKRYRLERKLGAGGMGSVWLAYDLSLDTRCALKLIDDEKAQNGEVRIRFEREAKAAAQLRGAHVVDVFEHGEWQGMLYIAMEYLEGEDLGARLTRVGSLDPESTYRIVAQVARALTRAHAYGIVHRDLKPENIFLVQGDEEEIAKVLDFGIAKHDAYSLQDKATRTGSFLGTPFYVSPEQARGKSIDHRSDLWSLGIIAFQCMTGHPPFESEALGELMGLILYEDLPRMTLKNPALPAALDAWWERAVARDREQRFQSAKELADALGQAIGAGKLLGVPSLPPRRASHPDGSGAFPSASASGSYPPLPALPPPPRLRLGAVPDDNAAEERTDAPVSRTRHPEPIGRSVLPVWFSRLKEQRKRTLVIGGVTAGVALGIALTLALLRSSDERAGTPGVALPERAAAAEADVALKTSALRGETKSGPTVTPVPPSASSESGRVSGPESGPVPVDLNTLPTEAEQKKKAAPPKRKVRGPDYGI